MGEAVNFQGDKMAMARLVIAAVVLVFSGSNAQDTNAPMPEKVSMAYADPKYASEEEGKIFENFKSSFEDNMGMFNGKMWEEEVARLFPTKVEKTIDLSKFQGNTQSFAKMAMKAAIQHGKKKGYEELAMLQRQYDALYNALQDARAELAELEAQKKALEKSPAALVSFLSATLQTADEQRNQALQKAASSKQAAMKHLISLSSVDQVFGEKNADEQYDKAVQDAEKEREHLLKVPRKVFNAQSNDQLYSVLKMLRAEQDEAAQLGNKMAIYKEQFQAKLQKDLKEQEQKMRAANERLLKEEEEQGNREIAQTKARIAEFVAHSDKVREQMKQNMIAKEKEMAAVAMMADVTNSSIKAKPVNATIFDWEAKKKQQMKRYEAAVKRQIDYFKADTNDKIADMDIEFATYHNTALKELVKLENEALGLAAYNSKVAGMLSEMTNAVDTALGAPAVNPKYVGKSVGELVGMMKAKKSEFDLKNGGGGAAKK